MAIASRAAFASSMDASAQLLDEPVASTVSSPRERVVVRVLRCVEKHFAGRTDELANIHVVNRRKL